MQRIATAIDGAAVRCRLLLLGFASEAESWYGRPEAAAVLAAKQWGGRVLQRVVHVGFATPWFQTCGRAGGRGAGRVVAAELSIQPLPSRSADAPVLWADVGGWAGEEYRAVVPRAEQHEAVGWLLGVQRGADAEGAAGVAYGSLRAGRSAGYAR